MESCGTSSQHIVGFVRQETPLSFGIQRCFWVLPFHRCDWLNHRCLIEPNLQLSAIPGFPSFPSFPLLGGLPVLKPQHSNHVVDLSNDWPPSWVFSSHSINSGVIWGVHEEQRHCCSEIPKIQNPLSGTQGQRPVTFFITQQEKRHYCA